MGYKLGKVAQGGQFQDSKTRRRPEKTTPCMALRGISEVKGEGLGARLDLCSTARDVFR